MGFQEAVGSAFSKFATFSGRARRAEYWWFALFCAIASLVLGLLDATLLGHSGPQSGPFDGLWSLIAFLPSLSVMVRRLHDVNRSGWWFWIVLIPVIGALLLLWWMIKPGDAGDNQFGPDPIAHPGSTQIPRVPRR
jgi:uncharacterized membrane protein YhaH (DUF805 family)